PSVELGTLSAKPRPTKSSGQRFGSRRMFLCYRRDDGGSTALRIYDRLARDFGKENIFKDVDDIPFGVDFVEHLEEEVKKYDVMFVIIGPRWFERGPNEERRIDNKYDFVRAESASALRRSIPVVPLLIDGASMPPANKLPDDIKALARRNGTVIR